MTDLVTALLEAKQTDLEAIDEEIRHLEGHVAKLRKARALLVVLFDDRPADALFPHLKDWTIIDNALKLDKEVEKLATDARASLAEKTRLADITVPPWTTPKKPAVPATEAARRSQEFKTKVIMLLGDGKTRTLKEIAEATGQAPQGHLAARLTKLGFVRNAEGWTVPSFWLRAELSPEEDDRPDPPAVPAVPPLIPLRQEIREALAETPAPMPARKRTSTLPPGTKRYRLFRDNDEGDEQAPAILVASFDEAGQAQSECDRIARISAIQHYVFDAGA